MKPGQVDLPIIWRGCEWPAIILRWKDQDGNPFNLTGWFAIAWTKDFLMNVGYDDPVNGVASISLTQEQTQPLKVGVHKWNWLFKKISTGQVFQPYLSGNVEVRSPIIMRVP